MGRVSLLHPFPLSPSEHLLLLGIPHFAIPPRRQRIRYTPFHIPQCCTIDVFLTLWFSERPEATMAQFNGASKFHFSRFRQARFDSETVHFFFSLLA